jgi:hypothetical protein
VVRISCRSSPVYHLRISRCRGCPAMSLPIGVGLTPHLPFLFKEAGQNCFPYRFPGIFRIGFNSAKRLFPCGGSRLCGSRFFCAATRGRYRIDTLPLAKAGGCHTTVPQVLQNAKRMIFSPPNQVNQANNLATHSTLA